MNNLIISTFSCSFDSFEKEITRLFLDDMCKKYISNYEFVKVDEYKAHTFLKVTDMEGLGSALELEVSKDCDNCQDSLYNLELVK